MKYHVNVLLNAPDEPATLKETALYVNLRKCSDNTGMQGNIYSVSSTMNNFCNTKGSIHIIDSNVTGEISMEYKNHCYHGVISGKSVCGGFTPIFTCISDLHSSDNDYPVHLECTFASVITELYSDHNIYERLTALCTHNTLPYGKYIAGWKE